MNTVPLAEVVVPEERFRKTFDQKQIDALAEDIAEVGLIHLPVLRAGAILVSGERRFRAISQLHAQGIAIKYIGQDIPAGHLPYAAYESLSELEAKEIELRENSVRVNLSWQEEAQATEALHNFKVAQNPEWNRSDTAKLIGGGVIQPTQSSTKVQEDLLLAKNLNLPEIKAAGSRKEAVKFLRKTLEREFALELAKRAPERKTPHTLLAGDSLELLKTLPSNKFECILTDPPYGIDATKFRANVKYNTAAHNYTDAWDYAKICYQTLAVEGFRVCQEQAHLYTFCDLRHFFVIEEIFHAAGWDVWPRPLIWSKQTGNLPKPDLGPRYTYETILYANKNQKPVSGLYPDIIQEAAGINKIHAAEKPVEVYINLLNRSIIGGAQVLDPFAGSGPIFPAANKLGCIATGIELDEDSLALCKQRLATFT